MKKNRITNLAFLFILLISCVNEKYNPFESGITYIGTTHYNKTSSDYGIWDTTFIDTFIVKKIGRDSVRFSNRHVSEQFKITSVHNYSAAFTPEFSRSFVFVGKKFDTLVYLSNTYSGYTSQFISTNTTFKGIKQP